MASHKARRDVKCPNRKCGRMFRASVEIPSTLPKRKSEGKNVTVVPATLMTELTCKHCGHTFQRQLTDILAGF